LDDAALLPNLLTDLPSLLVRWHRKLKHTCGLKEWETAERTLVSETAFRYDAGNEVMLFLQNPAVLPGCNNGEQ
jgi:hypothetical protein